jgi:sirohydrochlorin ferrochelatase
MTGYIVFAHGSSVESANEAVRAAARKAADRAQWEKYTTAFLGGGTPDLLGAVDQLAQAGVARIVVIPYFLTLGLHLERDLPVLMEQARLAHREIEIEAAPPLDGHPALIDALVDRSKLADRSKEILCRER